MAHLSGRLLGLSLAICFAGYPLCTRAADAVPADAAAPLRAARNAYLVVYSQGSAWITGKAMREQPNMREHFRYYIDLHRRGRLIAGGGFPDDSGGAAVIEAGDDAEAAAILAADPAVIGGTFRFELRRWKLNPWDEISRRQSAKGE